MSVYEQVSALKGNDRGAQGARTKPTAVDDKVAFEEPLRNVVRDAPSQIEPARSLRAGSWPLLPPGRLFRSVPKTGWGAAAFTERTVFTTFGRLEGLLGP